MEKMSKSFEKNKGHLDAVILLMQEMDEKEREIVAAYSEGYAAGLKMAKAG